MADENKICTCTTPEYTISLEKQGPPGVKGDTGENGFSPVITVAQNTLSNYSLNILTADGMVVTPNLKANLPAGGATGQVLTKNSGTQDDCSWQNLPNATTEVEGIARLATETDFETTEDSAVSDTSIVTPALFNSELKAQVGSYIVAGDNITTSVGEDGKVTINAEAEPYTLPQANATTLGGVKANEKTDEDTQAVNIDPATGLLYTKAGGGVTDAYTKAETDELLDAKQDILTPVQPLTVQNKIINNLVGFTYATEDTIKADTATSVLFCGGDYQENYKAIESGANPPTSYVAIPYSLGDVIGVPTESATQLLFGKFIGDDFYAVISGFLTQYYTTRNVPPLAFLETQPIPTTQEGNWGGVNTTTASTFVGEQPELNRTSYIQITQTGSSANIGVWWETSSAGSYYCTYDATATNAQVSSNLINEIDTVLFLSSNTTTTYPVSSFSRRACGVKKTVDINTLKNDILVNYPNIFDISSAEYKNYLEVQVDGTTITTNSSGKLQANIPSNLTTQGNTFNGASQLVQLDGDGKLPAVDGSQLTNLPGGNAFPSSVNLTTPNFNNVITEGLYWWSAYTTAQNHPNGNTKGYLMVMSLPGGNKVKQVFFEAEGNSTSEANTYNNMYMRICISNQSTGYGWSSWVKVNTTLPTITTPINILLKIDTTGLNTTVNNGATQNLLDLVSLTGSGTNVVTVANILATNYNLTGGILKLPYLPTVNSTYTNPYCDYTIDVRLTGTIAGGANTAREFSIELQRGSDNSLVERKAIVKVNGTDLASRGIAFNTFTNTSSDPFIAGGLKLILNNNSGQNITITGITILVKGRSY